MMLSKAQDVVRALGLNSGKAAVAKYDRYLHSRF